MFQLHIFAAWLYSYAHAFTKHITSEKKLKSSNVITMKIHIHV
jgi:hypothetical protein